ncbi:hypothetical protein FHR92_002117 [Fontibacillus solani]|uniref:Uncharacterized protein n=1 Tax=Fontibacillus solani TaxID=1572857 RepID=A0A7W3SSV0_9BACL|nr:hypothetical protein [Fontibacillus solani]MBA9085650.1 hypothetical protein [Fontibacillus solani]
MFLLIIAAALIAVIPDFMGLKKKHKYREITVSASILFVGLTFAVLRMCNVKLPSIFILSTKGLLMPLNNLVMKWFS